jgi:hypothetical protein
LQQIQIYYQERKFTMPEQAQTRKEVEEIIIAKAQADESFRQALLSNPKPTIEKELGGTLPESLQLKVVEESADTLYLVLPAAESQLSESELDAVSGGQSSLFAKKGVSAVIFY